MVRTAWMSERVGGEEEGWREVKIAVAFERFSLWSLVTCQHLLIELKQGHLSSPLHIADSLGFQGVALS
jgi:hypothetical protein